MDADTSELDPERLRGWLAAAVDASVSAVSIHRLSGGHSSGAWRLDVTVADGCRSMVLKAPTEPSVVYQRDACREGRIMGALNRFGAPVPAVLAIDTGTRAASRPCFVMELVDGRSVADGSAGAYHDDAELRKAPVEAQRALWHSFHDALAALHSVDPTHVPAAVLGDGTANDVLAYWRESLLDAAPRELVPRQLRALDWLREHNPPDADEAPAVCLGDARLVNGIFQGYDVRALVDFEVAYVGNPAADVGYSLFLEQMHQQNSEDPLPLPSADETWERWARATGRSVKHRAYWTAFGATILCITATRAVIQWGVAGDDPEGANPIVSRWESTIEVAAK